MRRLLSFHRSYTSRRRGAWLHFAPPLFRLFSPLPDPWGWGVAAVPPQPAFLMEVNQDDNHSR
jgi:hypothetical protein